MSADETIDLVASAANQKIPLDSLVASAIESFRQIEPWSQATSTDPALLNFTKKIQVQVLGYYQALDTSLEIADSGYAFSQTSEELCQYLIDPANSNDDLADFIQGMREAAKDSHEKAEYMGEQFRKVRMNINQITKNIPNEVKLQEEKRIYACGKVESAKWKLNACRDAGGMTQGIIILPMILQVAENKYSKIVTKREKVARNYMDAIEWLHQASSDLSTFVEHVGVFAGWWIQMDTMLAAVEAKIGTLRADLIRILNVKSVSQGLKGVGQSYLNYKQQISKLQDNFPQSRKIEDAGGNFKHR